MNLPIIYHVGHEQGEIEGYRDAMDGVKKQPEPDISKKYSSYTEDENASYMYGFETGYTVGYNNGLVDSMDD